MQWLAGGKEISFQVESAHLRFWLAETMPVILVVYDVGAEVAYWLYVQAYFESQPGLSLDNAGAEFTVRIPRQNVLNQAAILRFAGYRNLVRAQMKGVVHYHE